ncbi:hypothetical protein EDD11_009521 [Mortierella claussenii]|nr:hypothetical protein EDD11_009521 [Mortierella claussenii]
MRSRSKVDRIDLPGDVGGERPVDVDGERSGDAAGTERTEGAGCVNEMWTRIGVPDVRWMVEHWPKLERIYGLRGGEGNDEGTEA